LLFTDGITEAEGPDEQEFGESKIAACAQENWTKTASELNRLLLTQVDTFCGARFQDDATLLVVAAK
jgi:serine phosphatase RsbU (regulator of sigma subunit)